MPEPFGKNGPFVKSGTHQQRHHPATMREDEADAGMAPQRARHHQAQHRARGVDRPFDPRSVHPRLVVGHRGGRAAGGVVRVDEHHCVAVVKLRPDRLEGVIAQPKVAIARRDAEAFGLELVEGTVDLRQRALHIGERERGEQAELPRITAGEIGVVIVPSARLVGPFRPAALADRPRITDADRDTRAVHSRDRAFGGSIPPTSV